jgi:hypothetical protein
MHQGFNMNSKYKVVWEKWRDPFGDEELHQVIEDNQQYAEERFIEENDLSEFIEELTEEEKESLEEEAEEATQSAFSPAPIKAINTPMGIIPYAEQTASGKIFNFWIGHTNFNITEPIQNIIEHCVGTESLDIFTRYRFRIAIGKLFTERDIMADINNRILAYLESKEVDYNNGGK